MIFMDFPVLPTVSFTTCKSDEFYAPYLQGLELEDPTLICVFKFRYLLLVLVSTYLIALISYCNFLSS